MRVVEVNILNSKYRLKTDVPERDFNEIITILNKRINELKHTAGTLSNNKLTILAAICLAEEIYFGAKKIDSLIQKISLMENS